MELHMRYTIRAASLACNVLDDRSNPPSSSRQSTMSLKNFELNEGFGKVLRFLLDLITTILLFVYVPALLAYCSGACFVESSTRNCLSCCGLDTVHPSYILAVLYIFAVLVIIFGIHVYIFLYLGLALPTCAVFLTGY